MRDRTLFPALCFATLAAAPLAGCATGTTITADPPASSSASPEPTEVDPTDELPAVVVPTQPADSGYATAPAVAPLPGTAVSNGTVSITIPDGFDSVPVDDFGHHYVGPAIEESAVTVGDGTTTTAASIMMWAPQSSPGWLGGIDANPGDETAQTTYALDIPGADRASFRFESVAAPGADVGAAQLIAGGTGTASIAVLVGDQLTWISFTTHPGAAGLNQALAFASAITIH